jgi:excisionase family DNA binding protein
MNGYLTLKEVAEELGASLHSVRFWVKSGTLPSVRPGRLRIVERSALRAFMQRNARGYGAGGEP